MIEKCNGDNIKYNKRFFKSRKEKYEKNFSEM